MNEFCIGFQVRRKKEKKREKEKQEEYIRTAGEEGDKYIVIVFLILMSLYELTGES